MFNRGWILGHKAELFTVISACIFLFSLAFIFFNTADFTPLQAEVVEEEPQAATVVIDEETRAYFKTNPSFPELSDYLTSLAEREGARYALDVLITTNELPPNIDAHLMGHNVARKLYEQEGIDGLVYCTEDLGYACAHALVIEALFERGMVVFDEINEICDRVEGNGAYMMCFHGFGHGVLAYVDYELPEAIELCGKVGTQEYWFYDAVECVGGAVMEMRGGIHDPELWEQNGKKYLNDEDPLQMCLAEYMKEEYRYICFVYITPFIFDSLGAADIPSFEDYGPAIRTCNVLENSEYREACYGGFAKEFVGFLFGRDIRLIENMTEAQLREIYAACELAEVEDGIAACVKHTILDLFGTGLHRFEIAGAFCTIVDPQFGDYCVTNFMQTADDRNAFDEEDEIAYCSYTEKVFGRKCFLTD